MRQLIRLQIQTDQMRVTENGIRKVFEVVEAQMQKRQIRQIENASFQSLDVITFQA